FALALTLGASAASARATSGLILVFDMRPDGWTLKATLRPIPTPMAPRWAIRGTLRCHGSRCPGRRARVSGSVGPQGTAFIAEGTFPSGVRCTFSGTLSDPEAPQRYRCVDRAGATFIDDTFHVGGCRCGDRLGTDSGFCATEPCPF